MATVPIVQGRTERETALRGQQQLQAPAFPRVPMPASQLPKPRSSINLVHNTIRPQTQIAHTVSTSTPVLDGLQRMTEAAGKAAALIVDRQEGILAEQAYSKIMREYLDFDDQQRKSNVGERGVGHAAAADAWWATNGAAELEELPPGARARLAPQIANQAIRSYSAALQHEAGELHKAGVNAFNSSLAVRLEDGIRNGPEAAPGTVAEIRAQVQDFGTAQGWNQDQKDEALESWTTQFHKRMVDQMVANRDLRGASDYFSKYGDQISAVQRTQITSTLQVAKQSFAAQHAADRIFGSGGSRTEMIARAMALPADVREAASNKLLQTFRMVDAAKNHVEGENWDRVQRHLAFAQSQGVPLLVDDIPHEILEQLTGEQWAKLTAYTGEMEAAQQQQVLQNSVDTWHMIHMRHPEIFDKADLLAPVPVLPADPENGRAHDAPLPITEKARRELYAMQQERKKLPDGFDTRANQTIDRYLATRDMSEKDEAEWRWQLQGHIVDYLKKTGKESLTFSELEDIMVGMTLSAPVGGWPWSSKLRAFEVQDEPTARLWRKNAKVPAADRAPLQQRYFAMHGEMPTEEQLLDLYMEGSVLYNPPGVAPPDQYAPGIPGMQYLLGLPPEPVSKPQNTRANPRQGR